MKKNIIKEIIILLLLTLAIILILGVLLYGFLPTNKIIPEAVSYTTPANIQSELQSDENIDDSEVVVTYQIDSTDLSNYKKTQDYVPGKKNPFETIDTTDETTGNETTTEETQTNSNVSKDTTTTSTATGSTSTSTESSSNSGTSYLPDKGTK